MAAISIGHVPVFDKEDLDKEDPARIYFPTGRNLFNNIPDDQSMLHNYRSLLPIVIIHERDIAL